MGIIKNRWLTAVSLIIVLFVVTACFQQVGDEAQGQAVSIQITATPPPTLTPEPTDEPTAADLPISNNPTATETSTEIPTDTATPFAVAQAGGTATPIVDTYSLTATQLVADTTSTAGVPLTLTSIFINGVTNTPTATLLPVNNTGTTNFNNGIDCVHEVRTGETMYSYSRYYGVSVADIATRNGIVNANIISIGQMLTIPGCGTNGVLPPPTSVPTLTVTPFQLSTPFGQGGTDQNANLGQGGGIATNVACVSQYTVQQYDTLFQISITHGVPVQSIANANAILNLGRIDMGDVLCIPAQ